MSLIVAVIDDEPPPRPTIGFGIELRRALLGILLIERRPMSLSEIDTALRGLGMITHPGLVRPTNRVLSDMLSYQLRLGRVRRVRRGVYEVLPDSMSYMMRWRCQRVVRLRCGGR